MTTTTKPELVTIKLTRAESSKLRGWLGGLDVSDIDPVLQAAINKITATK
jgi:hypothetical protein